MAERKDLSAEAMLEKKLKLEKLLRQPIDEFHEETPEVLRQRLRERVRFALPRWPLRLYLAPVPDGHAARGCQGCETAMVAFRAWLKEQSTPGRASYVVVKVEPSVYVEIDVVAQ